MTLLEYMRGSAFWTMDALKGGKVKKSLNILKNCEDGIWDENTIKKYQDHAVKELLLHAKNTVPFYKGQESLELSSWPVVNKNVLRSQGDAVLSSEYTKNHLIQMATSGSTGTPFASYQDIGKKKHVNAETLYYNGKIGFSIGRRIIYLRSVVGEVSKSGLQQFAQNIYLLDCNDLSDEGIKKKLQFIVKYSKGCGAMMMGYASTLTAFQKYFNKYGYNGVKNANIYGVISGSEMLYDATRESIEKAFRCRCISRYANEENGFLGQDDTENNTFFMNQADYFIEVLKVDRDEPAELGKIGRIVVTDLYNYAMPMIRYDTGDVGAYVYCKSNGKDRLAISSFGGRIVDTVYDCKGNLVSPHAITNLMWKYQDVKQFQFIQKGKGKYTLVLNLGGTVIDEKVIVCEYKKVFGRDSDFKIEYCNDIPVLASGKRRYIINEAGK
ncbi:MAG: hypothetical protein PHY47_22695 [Lachnospiraceae bacterium]|nr:hypothetical protein [Lachnospiraceae bacterium]